MNLTKREIFILVFVIVALVSWRLLVAYGPNDPKPHVPVKSFALWFIDPKTGRDTGTTVFRLDYDTAAPYKKWNTPRYYLPINKIDTIRIAGKADSIVSEKGFMLTSDPIYIIHDFDKNYK